MSEKIYILLPGQKTGQDMTVGAINWALLDGKFTRETKAWTKRLDKTWDTLAHPIFKELGVRLLQPPDYDALLEEVDENLPTLPNIVSKLTSILDDDENTRVDELTESMDQSLTAAVLEVVNSVHYRQGDDRHVDDTEEAIIIIGLGEFRRIVSKIKALAFLKGASDEDGFSLSELWKHSFGVGETSRVIAKYLNEKRHVEWNERLLESKEGINKPPKPKELDHELAYICGLLHGIGKVALYDLRRATFLQNCKDALDRETDLLTAEIENQSYKYHEVGHLMFQKWDQGERLTYVIGRHHELNHKERGFCPTDPDVDKCPEEERARKQAEYEKETHEFVDIVILAIWIMRDQGFGSSGNPYPTNPSDEILTRLDLGHQNFQKLQDVAKKERRRTMAFLESLNN
jgi:HD-like signal output (HDOD) protein